MHKNTFAILFIIFFIILVLVFAILDKVSPLSALISIVTISATFYVFNVKVTMLSQRFTGESDVMAERINLLDEELKTKNNIVRELPKRIFSIKDITQKFINLTEPDEVRRVLVKELEAIFPEADNILLFLFPTDKDYLILQESLRKNNEIIREKDRSRNAAFVLSWQVLYLSVPR